MITFNCYVVKQSRSYLLSYQIIIFIKKNKISSNLNNFFYIENK